MEHGIDPEILGVNRVNGLKNMVLKEAKAGKLSGGSWRRISFEAMPKAHGGSICG